MKNLFLLFLLLASLGSGCSDLYRIQQSTALTKVSQFDSPEVLTTSQWQYYACKNRINIRTGKSQNPVTVLGHYPEYVELAAKLGAESMQIPMDKWDAMSPEEQWHTTVEFFDSMIKKSHNFRLATPVGKARPGSYYVRELNYLFGKGYKLSPDGLWLVK